LIVGNIAWNVNYYYYFDSFAEIKLVLIVIKFAIVVGGGMR